MPNFKDIAIPALSGLGATAVYDQLAYPKDYRPFDDYRRGLNTTFNMGLTTAGAAMMMHGHGGNKMMGAGLMTTPPIKDLALMAQKPLSDASETSKTIGRNSTIGTALGAGALGLGGLALAKYISSKAKQDSPRVKVTLPTKSPTDHETTVDLPLDDKSLPPATQMRMYQQLRRQLRAETRERALKRDLNTGKLIPLKKWEDLYGDKANQGSQKQVSQEQIMDHMKAASETFEDMMFLVEKRAGLAGAARTAATLTPGVSASALPKLDEGAGAPGATAGGPSLPMSLQGDPSAQADAALEQEAIQGQLTDQQKQIQDAAGQQQDLTAKLHQTELEKKHVENQASQQLEQLKTQHTAELAQIQSQSEQQAQQAMAEAEKVKQESQREVAEAQHGAEIEKQKASLQIETNKAQNDIMSAAQTAQNPTGVSPALETQLGNAISSISKLASLGIFVKTAGVGAPAPVMNKKVTPSSPAPGSNAPAAPSAPAGAHPLAGTSPSAASAQGQPMVGQVPAAQRQNPSITNTVRPGVSANNLAGEKVLPPELSGQLSQQQWDTMDRSGRIQHSLNPDAQKRRAEVRTQQSQLADAQDFERDSGGLAAGRGYWGTMMKAVDEGRDSANLFGETKGKGWLGNTATGVGNWLGDLGLGAARAVTDSANANQYNNTLADQMGLSRGRNSFFGRMAGGIGDYAQMGSLGLRKAFRGISSPFQDADYSDIDSQWNNIQSRRGKYDAFEKAKTQAGTNFNTALNSYRGALGTSAAAAGMLMPGIGTGLTALGAGMMGTSGGRQMNTSPVGYGMKSAPPPMMAQAQPTGWASQNYDPYGDTPTFSPWAKPAAFTSKVGRGAENLTSITRTTALLKRALSAPPQVGPPAPAPAVGPPKPSALPQGPAPVPMRAAQQNGYFRPNQFRGGASDALEFGSPMKNALLNYALPAGNMIGQMFGLPSLMPTAKPVYTSQNVMQHMPSNVDQSMAELGIQSRRPNGYSL